MLPGAARKRPRDSVVALDTRQGISNADRLPPAPPPPPPRSVATLHLPTCSQSNPHSQTPAEDAENCVESTQGQTWTLEEDSRFLEEVLQHGPRFAFLSRLHVPQRSADSLRRRWVFLQAVILESRHGPMEGSDSVTEDSAEALKGLLRQWYASNGRCATGRSRSSTACGVTQEAVLGRLSHLLPKRYCGTTAPRQMPVAGLRGTSPDSAHLKAEQTSLGSASALSSERSAARPSAPAAVGRSSSNQSCAPALTAGCRVSTMPWFVEVATQPSAVSSGQGSVWRDDRSDRSALAHAELSATRHRQSSSTVDDGFSDEITADAIQAFIAKLVEEHVTQPPRREAVQSHSAHIEVLEPLLEAMEHAERSNDGSLHRECQAEVSPLLPLPRQGAGPATWGKQDQLARAVTSSIHTQMYLEHAAKNHHPFGYPSPGGASSAGAGSSAASDCSGSFNRNNAATAVMAAWLGGASAPLWTNIFEPPRCLWKATLVPRVLGALFPMPFVCSFRLDMLCPRRILAGTFGATTFAPEPRTEAPPNTASPPPLERRNGRVNDETESWRGSRDFCQLVPCLG